MDKIAHFFGDYRWLSNFWDSPIVIRGKGYPTVEHYYQAMKALHESDHEWIRLSKSPGEAKRRGKQVPIKPDWEELKVAVMLEALNEKFKIQKLRNMLIATYPKEIIEGNTWGDTFWGVCKGVGQNTLGKLLMNLREDIRCQS